MHARLKTLTVPKKKRGFMGFLYVSFLSSFNPLHYPNTITLLKCISGARVLQDIYCSFNVFMTPSALVSLTGLLRTSLADVVWGSQGHMTSHDLGVLLGVWCWYCPGSVVEWLQISRFTVISRFFVVKVWLGWFVFSRVVSSQERW